jgi:acyl-CoA reductase-like NAD-dependent aldehyde dehydrogenase
LRSYSVFIDGEEVAGAGWTYVIRADELIDDPRGAFQAKRRLELDRDPTDADRRKCAGRCAWSTDEQGEAALAAARRAFSEWLDADVEARRELAGLLHSALVAHSEEIREVLIAEGHPRRLADIEVDGFVTALDPRTVDWCFAQMHQRHDVGDREVLLVRKPDGVVCVNPPQNAAASSAALGIMAILAGNALVVKAPRTVPLGVMYLYREIVIPTLLEFGAPAGLVNIVSSETKPTLRQWLESPLVDDIMYFGDSPSGLRFAEECLSRGKKPILELAGNDAFVVWRDAQLDAAVESLCQSFYGSTQICMAPKQVFLHPAVAEEFLELLADRVRRIAPRPLDDPEAVLSPVLKVDKFADMLAEVENAGGVLLCGGRRIELDGSPSPSGLFVEPTVVRLDGLEASRRVRCVGEETFFPLLPVVVLDPRPDDALLDEVLETMNGNPFGLRNSFWTGSDRIVDAVSRRVLNGGLLQINESHLGVSPYLATHGGTGQTGGPFGELNYPMLRTSHLQGINRRRVPAAAPAGAEDKSVAHA